MHRPLAEKFEDLAIWQRGHEFVLAVYRFSERFPRHELYGLTQQLRKAAVSVPANVAEGFKRRGRVEKLRFLNIAQGSLEEARYYLLLARDLGYGDEEALRMLADEVGRVIGAYARSVKKDILRSASSNLLFCILPSMFYVLFNA
jgi:four helix bundle protein